MRRRHACFGLNVKGAIVVNPNGMTTDEAMIVAKTRAFALDHKVEEGEGDGGTGEGDPSPGLGQETGHGTAVIEDDRVPDGDRDDEDVLELLGREVVRRMRQKWLCKFEEGLGDLAGGELLRGRPFGCGRRTLALAHGFLTCRPMEPHEAQWLESAGTATQARHTMEHAAVPEGAQHRGNRIQAMNMPQWRTASTPMHGTGGVSQMREWLAGVSRGS